MKAIQITEYLKGPRELTVTSLPDPKPAKDEYLIRIHASATNFFDLLQIRGKYQQQPPFPWISGSEFSGTIISVPSASSKKPTFRVGDRVFGATQGSYATHICCKEANLLPVPEEWSFEDAAGLMVTAPTSYGALVTRANIKQGDWVLVHAAAGGVGLAAVQVAKAFGATVIATAGTERKMQVAKNFGADYIIDYKVNGWEEEVKKLCKAHGRQGVDIVFDPVGLIDKSLKCTAWNGRIVVIGFAAGQIEKVAMNKVLLKNVSIVGLFWGMYSKMEPETVKSVWADLFRLIREGKFRGTVFQDKRYVGLERVGAALQALGARETWGKVVVTVPQNDASNSKL